MSPILITDLIWGLIEPTLKFKTLLLASLIYIIQLSGDLMLKIVYGDFSVPDSTLHVREPFSELNSYSIFTILWLMKYKMKCLLLSHDMHIVCCFTLQLATQTKTICTLCWYMLVSNQHTGIIKGKQQLHTLLIASWYQYT